jgi:hypothetical protein
MSTRAKRSQESLTFAGQTPQSGRFVSANRDSDLSVGFVERKVVKIVNPCSGAQPKRVGPVETRHATWMFVSILTGPTSDFRNLIGV